MLVKPTFTLIGGSYLNLASELYITPAARILLFYKAYSTLSPPVFVLKSSLLIIVLISN